MSQYQEQKIREFNLLRVHFWTGQAIASNRPDGFNRYGGIKYKMAYRHGIMTDSGDIELNEWKTKARALIEKYGEIDIFEKLLKDHVFPSYRESEKDQYALELHMARIFENPEWVCYEKFKASFLDAREADKPMKINVTVDVPDDDTCFGCDLWWRDKDKKPYCLVFGFVELKEQYKENMVAGTDVIKCDACKKAGRPMADSNNAKSTNFDISLDDLLKQ